MCRGNILAGSCTRALCILCVLLHHIIADTSAVYPHCRKVFNNAADFNQDVSKWDVAKATTFKFVCTLANTRRIVYTTTVHSVPLRSGSHTLKAWGLASTISADTHVKNKVRIVVNRVS